MSRRDRRAGRSFGNVALDGRIVPAHLMADVELAARLWDAGDYPALVACSERLLAGRFASPVHLAWYACALTALGDHAKALSINDRGVVVADHVGDRSNNRLWRATERARAGDFLALHDLDFRFSTGAWPLGAPPRLWQGEPLNGRRLVVWDEWGFGDTLLMARFVAPLLRPGVNLTLAVAEPLARLFVSPWAKTVAVPRRSLPKTRHPENLVGEHDVICPLWSLPHRLGAIELPRKPYLDAPLELVAQWHERLAGVGQGARLRVGLVWAGDGSYEPEMDRLRSPRLPAVLPLLDALPDVHFVGLQLGDGRRDLAGCDMPGNFTDLASEISDFADTAAIIENLDVTVTSCTAVAHLAGALGKIVFVMLPQFAWWPWGTRPSDCDWYPSARLFRCAGPKAWEPVVRDVADALAARAAAIAA